MPRKKLGVECDYCLSNDCVRDDENSECPVSQRDRVSIRVIQLEQLLLRCAAQLDREYSERASRALSNRVLEVLGKVRLDPAILLDAWEEKEE